MLGVRTRRPIAAIAVVAIAAAVFAGCQSKSDSAGGGNAGGSAAPIDTLRVGIDVSYPPLEFYDGSTPTGVDIEVAQAIGREIGVPVKIENIGFDSLITSLRAKRIDMIISGMQDTPGRQQIMNMIDYLRTSETILVKKGNPEHITSLPTMCGHRVGQLSGSTTLQQVKDASADCSGDPIEVLTFDSNSDINLAIKAGRIDANLDDAVSLNYVAKTSGQGNDFDAVDQPSDGRHFFGIATLKTEQDVTKEVVDAYTAIFNDGTLKKIYDKWGIPNSTPPQVLQNHGAD